MTLGDIQLQLQLPYARERWLKLLKALLPSTEVFSLAQGLPLHNFKVVAAAQIARIPLSDGRIVAVLEVEVSGKVDLQRNRVGLRNLVARFIDQHNAHAVLGFFRGEDSVDGDYRLSLVARSSELTKDGQLSRTETDKRRYTYILGRGQPCRTPAERLDLLRKREGKVTLGDIVEAFNVEPLFKEFFHDYGKVFDKVESLIKPTIPDKEPLRLFTQRLFNRLMFLAFIQRKGWLKWEQRTDYLAALWDARRHGKNANFYRDHLVPLFFEGLNQPGRPPGHIDPRFGSVEYLNGGLFEKADDGTDDRPGIIVPDEALDAILSGLFARYNFTVAESTPLDVEVAVDPEMLGKVFEELVTGRHEQGSYYTPKPIVSFMCREALVGHLASRCEKETRAALEDFVHDHQPGGLRDAEPVLAALRTVTVCDPACGSGAYLLGMLHELLDLRTCLFAANQKLDPHTAHGRKLEIIERNLYGVDKDPFAVNIARLRLWLSLAVEYDGSHPPPALPNLDFKIEQGDSLAGPAPADVLREAGNLPLLLPTVRDFAAKKAKFLTAHGSEKEALKQGIATLKKSLKTWLATEGPADAFHWALEYAEVFLPNPATTSLTGGLNLGIELAPTAMPGGFDIIVANPPYVRMELIKSQKPILRKRFPLVHAERADLYVYFFARAHELLCKGGTAAFISSNKWLRAGYGEPLRKHLLDSQDFGVVMDFGDLPVFESTSAYPCIFIWKKESRRESATRWASVRDLAACYSEGVRNHFLRISLSVPSSQFLSGGARLTDTASTGRQQVMERAGPRLKNVPGLSIIYGLKTGLNQAFVLTANQRRDLIDEDGRSDEVIKPLLFGANIRRYHLTPSGEYIIYTPHGFDIEKYPAIARYLSKFRKLPVTAGKKLRGLDYRATSQKWFELQQPQEAYVPRFLGPKVVYPDITRESRFAFDNAGYFLETTCFAVANADYYILAILNSSTAWWYLTNCVAQIRGGFLRFKAQYIEAVPIPTASDANRTIVSELAKQTQVLHARRRARVERFLHDIGVEIAQSTSRNPLEQPWSLTFAEFAKRSKPLQRVARERPQLIYEAARDETAALTEQIAKVEAEIDSRVATLYGLDAEDQRWATQASPSAKSDDKQSLFFRVLGQLKESRPYFRLDEIQTAANDEELALKDSSLKVYLSEAVKQGHIHDAGRGWYSRLSDPVPLDPKPVAKLIRDVEKAFPLLEFTVWSTAQINPWMHHLLAQPVAFLHTPSDALESVGDTLRAKGWEVAVNPPPSVGPKTVRPGDKMVVLRPTLTKQPTSQGRQDSIEKILVDLVAEAPRLSLMDQSEAEEVVRMATSRYLIQLAEMQSYAKFRKLKSEVFE